MKRKRVLITGVSGQDGYYLSEFLVQKDYEVYGLLRRTSNNPLIKFESQPELKRQITFLYGNLRDLNTLKNALRTAGPDEIYNLASQSDVGISFLCPEETMEVNYYGVGRLVNEAMALNPKVKIYQASTSEMFGQSPPPQNEKTLFNPVSPYALAKLKAHEDFVVGYRQKHGLFICSGFMFNHESPRRGEHFVTRKIIISLAKIKLGLQDYFELGNLDAKRDWGFAGDYVKAMWLMLQQEKPKDFVIATGEAHSVRAFVEEAAGFLDMKIRWRGRGVKEVGVDENGKAIVKVNSKFYRPADPYYLCGDASRARKLLGWQPEVKFKDLVKMMVESDLELIRRHHAGTA